MKRSLTRRLTQLLFWLLFPAICLLGVWPSQGQTPDIIAIYSNAFFKVKAPVPKYAGGSTCAECHQVIHNSQMNTAHADAFQALKNLGQQTNPNCLPCHTVGYSLPSGFVSEQQTPQLEGVQCESCHGPAAYHRASPYAPRYRPLTASGTNTITINGITYMESSGMICGGCHTRHQPTYQQWTNSGHAIVVEDLNPSSRISACGRCHSGSVHANFLKNRAAPAGKANVPVDCATCHDPHAEHTWTNVLSGEVYTNEVRNPLSSTNDYFMSTTDTFIKKYNPNINVCGQCHNYRGDTWQGNSRPPHNSAQYNMLLGTVGELTNGLPHYQPATHALALANQCVDCHMQITSIPANTNFPAIPDHTFTVQQFTICTQCHPSPQQLVQFTQTAVSNQVADVKFALDFWATTRAPLALRQKYGVMAWEYTTPGTLSSGTTGPNANEQRLIPVNIQKARYNMYLIWNEGSLGVHNGPFTTSLLDAAETFVMDELD